MRKEQKLRYKGKDYQYRIGKESLEKMERETGKGIKEVLGDDYLGTVRALYYITEWKREDPGETTFVNGYKKGEVSLMPHKERYGIHEIRKLIQQAKIRYGL